MKAHIITIFPESFESYFSSSMMWKAKQNWFCDIFLYKLNDFSDDNFKRVDSRAYWMHWQILRADVLALAIEHIFEKVGEKIPVVYMSPKWDLLNQEKVEKYYDILWEDFIIICGHYEWIDQRIIDIYVDYEISIWEYVLSSWELAASVFLDSLIRNIPWVLNNEKSLLEDSFSDSFNRQKEYPLYTRPKEFMWLDVPEILLSWNHKEIEKWKKNNLT